MPKSLLAQIRKFKKMLIEYSVATRRNNSGVVPIPVLVAAIGLVAFLVVSSTAPFKNSLFSGLFPKQSSFAAATILVGTDGYPTINAAIQAALPGDTISIHGGTYNEQVDITKKLTLTAFGDGSVWIDGQCQRAHAIQVRVAGASDSVIRGLGLRNTTEGAMYIEGPDGGSASQRPSNITIDQNTITDFNCVASQGAQYKAGVASWYGGSGIKITNNTITWRSVGSNDGSGANCIWFKSNSANPSGGGHLISGNTITGCRDGIGGEQEDDYDHGQFDGNTIIENNLVQDCWDDGIQIEGNGDGVIARNNTIKRCAIGFANAPAAGTARIENNTILEGRVGGYGNVACFKMGNNGGGITYYTNNRCVLTATNANGWQQTNVGNNDIVASGNQINVGRYVIEFTSVVAGVTQFNNDCLYTSDPTRFVKWGSSGALYTTFEAFRSATGQEAQGQSNSSCGSQPIGSPLPSASVMPSASAAPTATPSIAPSSSPSPTPPGGGPQPGATTVGALTLASTYESISVYANFSGDDGDNQASMQYRKVGDANWKTGLAMTADRRAQVTGGTSGIYTNPFVNQFRTSIIGATPNTQYEVRVTFTDSDGIVGTNPATATVTTRDENIPLGSGVNRFVGAIPAGSTGTAYSTIQAAVNAASAGDKIYLRAGTYNELVSINKSGTANNWITMLSYNNESVTIDGQNTRGNNLSITGSRFLRIKGLRLANSTTRSISLDATASDIVIEDNTIDGFAGQAFYAGQSSSPASNANIVLQRNTITASKSISNHIVNFLRTTGGGHIIRNNTFRDVTGIAHTTSLWWDCLGGESNFGVDGFVYRDSDIYNNTFEGCNDEAIEVEGGNVNVRVWGNNISAGGNGFIGIGSNATVVGPLYVFGNIVYGQTASSLKQGSNSTGFQYFYNNTFYSTGNGFDRTNPGLSNVISRNNIIHAGIYVIQYDATVDVSTMSFDYDNMYTTDPNRFIKWGSNTGNYFNFAGFKNTGQEANGISVNSTNEFVNAAGGNFALKSGSQFLDKGVVIPGLNDAGSKLAFAGPAPDIGACEGASCPTGAGGTVPPPSPGPSPTPAPCTLTSVTWSSTSVNEGAAVTLVAVGNSNCTATDRVTFDIRENNTSLPDTDITPDPTNVTYSNAGRTWSTTWNAIYQDDALDLASPAGPEYYFNAALNEGNPTRSADPLLRVTQSGGGPTPTPSPTSTPSSAPTPAPGTTLGQTTIGGTSDSNDRNSMTGSNFTTGSSAGAVTSITAYVGPVDAAPNNQFQMAIYTNSNGNPSSLVASTTSGNLIANSWNTLPITATLSPNTTYWLMYNTNATIGSVNNLVYDVVAGRMRWKGQTFGTWPSSYGIGTSQDALVSMYVTYGSGGSPQPTPSGSAAPTPTPAPCTLTGAAWSASNVSEGTVVTLTATGSSTCTTANAVTFDIRENNTGAPDTDVTSDPTNISYSPAARTWSATWVTTYQDDLFDILSPAGPEYFFNVILNGGNTLRSADPLLKVIQAGTGGLPPTTIDFNDRASGALNGQYPAGIADWGSGVFNESGPYLLFQSNHIYLLNNATSGTMTFITPAKLDSVQAFNEPGGAGTVTLNCSGNPTVTQNMAENTVATIITGWTANCAGPLTIGSSRGGSINFDNFVLSDQSYVAPQPTPTSAPGEFTNFVDGFESTDLSGYTIEGAASVIPQAAYGGSNSGLYIDARNDDDARIIKLTTGSPQLYSRIRVKLVKDINESTDQQFFTLGPSTWPPAVGLTIRTRVSQNYTNQLHFFHPDNGLGTTNISLNAGQWYTFEMLYEPGTDAKYQVWMDGGSTPIISAGGNWGGEPVARIVLGADGGAESNGNEYYMDDFALSNATRIGTGVPPFGFGPTRSNGSPSGNIPESTTSTTISVNTNVPATCKYGTSSNIDYTNMTNTFSTTGGTTHSQLVTGLSAGNTYQYYVRCIDGAGAKNMDDYVILFKTTVNTLKIDQNTSITLIPNFEAMSVYAKYTGDINANGTAQIYYRKVGDTAWKKSMKMLAERRSNITAERRSEFRGSIFGLTPNTNYEVEVRFSDPDGVNGTNPNFSVQEATQTRDDNPPGTIIPTSTTGGFTISNSGTPTNWLIYQPPAGQTVTITGGVNINGSYVKLRGFNFTGGGISTGTIQINRFVSNVIIEDNNFTVYGIPTLREGGDYSGESATTENVTIQRNTYIHPSGATSHAQKWVDFVNNTRGGHVIRNNSFRDLTGVARGNPYWDCIGGAPNFSENGFVHRDSDINDNYFEGCNDDQLEADGGNMNVRIWENTFNGGLNGYQSMSVDPTLLGPLYVVRNVSYGNHASAFSKLGSSSDGPIYFYHNTNYTTAPTTGQGFAYANPGQENFNGRNNIQQVSRYAIEFTEGGDTHSFDYDNLFTTGVDLIKWDGAKFGNLADFSSNTGQETHGFSFNMVTDRINGFVNPAANDLHLLTSSALIDKGEVIDGINNADSPWPYFGTGPDIGVYETGVGGPAPSSTPEPSPAPCTLTAAAWSGTTGTVTEGTAVTLTTTGSSNCTTANSVNFDIRENNTGFLDSDIAPDPTNVSYSAATRTWSTTWTTTYQDDALDVLSPAGPEYFFNAILIGGNTVRSADPLLQVTQTGGGPTPTPTPTPQPTPKPGDMNGDNSVNVLDFGVLLANWNTSNSIADLNSDGVVNVLDFGILLSNWGT